MAARAGGLDQRADSFWTRAFAVTFGKCKILSVATGSHKLKVDTDLVLFANRLIPYLQIVFWVKFKERSLLSQTLAFDKAFIATIALNLRTFPWSSCHRFSICLLEYANLTNGSMLGSNTLVI